MAPHYLPARRRLVLSCNALKYSNTHYTNTNYTNTHYTNTNYTNTHYTNTSQLGPVSFCPVMLAKEHHCCSQLSIHFFQIIKLQRDTTSFMCTPSLDTKLDLALGSSSMKEVEMRSWLFIATLACVPATKAITRGKLKENKPYILK